MRFLSKKKKKTSPNTEVTKNIEHDSIQTFPSRFSGLEEAERSRENVCSREKAELNEGSGGSTGNAGGTESGRKGPRAEETRRTIRGEGEDELGLRNQCHVMLQTEYFSSKSNFTDVDTGAAFRFYHRFFFFGLTF